MGLCTNAACLKRRDYAHHNRNNSYRVHGNLDGCHPQRPLQLLLVYCAQVPVCFGCPACCVCCTQQMAFILRRTSLCEVSLLFSADVRDLELRISA